MRHRSHTLHRAGSNPHNGNLSQENEHDEFAYLLSFCCYCTATAIAVPVETTITSGVAGRCSPAAPDPHPPLPRRLHTINLAILACPPPAGSSNLFSQLHNFNAQIGVTSSNGYPKVQCQ